MARSLVLSLYLAGQIPPLAAGEDLVNLATREVWSAEGALADGKLLIYLTKDCPACRAYLARLESCEGLGARLRYVALETPARAKQMRAKLGESSNLAVRLIPGAGPPIGATPHTRGSTISKVGILSCEELRGLK